ncbi:hypothetical protein [Streptomyces roseus]|uniref:Uncharacterized protein n=1 Tax=Streptomyces roseus TaxID=66430 RepID=A0A0J6XGN6_9ACTN|nr:hypothetical protein [Streptomyces roseus]KMO95155.1 hypothetical protein ACS04_25340 [Streptomyces roseus]
MDDALTTVALLLVVAAATLAVLCREPVRQAAALAVLGRGRVFRIMADPGHLAPRLAAFSSVADTPRRLPPRPCDARHQTPGLIHPDPKDTASR